MRRNNIENLEYTYATLLFFFLYNFKVGLNDTTFYVNVNPYKLLVNHCRINVRKQFSVSALLKYGIVLPPSIVNFEPLSSFRSSLNNVNRRIYTTY